MKRGNRFGRLGLGLVLCVTVTLAGCSTAWITEAEEVVAALIPAAANIIALVAALGGNSVSATDLQTIQNAGTQAGADLQLIQSLITAYQTADATAKPGILNQIQAAINAVQANLQGLLPALHIQDAATQAKITAVVGIVLSEVESLAAVVPVVNASGETPTPSARDARSGQALAAKNAAGMGHPQVKKQPPLTASEFVKSYNATLTAKTGNADLDRVTAGLKIHLHGKVARWATAGVLQ
jgi:hypothetical protein